jgi:hypothetical protein
MNCESSQFSSHGLFILTLVSPQEPDKTTVTVNTCVADFVPLFIPIFNTGNFNFELTFRIHTGLPTAGKHIYN